MQFYPAFFAIDIICGGKRVAIGACPDKRGIYRPTHRTGCRKSQIRLGVGGKKGICFWAKTNRLSDHSSIYCGENRSEEHTSELQSRGHLVCRLLLEKKNTLETRAT